MFPVIEYRLKHEYNASLRWEPLNLFKACWITGHAKDIEELRRKKIQYMAVDKHGRNVFMAESSYALNLAQENYPNLKFHFKSEF